MEKSIKQAMRNILTDLSDAGYGVTIQLENCKVCVNNRNVRSTYIYHQSYLSDQFGSFAIRYIDIIQDPGYVKAVVNFLWNKAPRSKGTKPKVLWMQGMLNYEEPAHLIEDMENFIKAADDDDILEQFLWEFWENNILPLRKLHHEDNKSNHTGSKLSEESATSAQGGGTLG